jgi:redox-sensitive bicupin YhaK (pirin superfamily)
MTHADSMGNRSIIRLGDVQRMSAGTGLTHSEFNLAETPVHFCQIWIYPDVRGLTPSYDQKHFQPASWHNQLFPVASGQNKPGTVTFHTDATIYRADLEKGKTIDFETDDSRRIFIYLTGGQASINGKPVKAQDQARIDLETAVRIEASNSTSLILIDVPSCKGWGYSRETLGGTKRK